MPALYVFSPVTSASSSAKNGTVSANNQLEEKKHETQIVNSKSRWVSKLQMSCTLFSGYPQPICQAAMIGPKPVTDPLSEVVRARLCGDQKILTNDYSTSGSVHQPDSSASLADLVHGFMEDQGEDCSNCYSGIGESCSEIETAEFSKTCQIIEAVCSCTRDTDLHLLGHVSNVMEIFEENGRFGSESHRDPQNGRNCLRRAVMSHLRAVGYNAGICKSHWEQIREFPAGDYEYIDVVIHEGRNSTKDRIFIDIDFREQFEVARPTEQYSALVQSLPDIFVGRADRLQQIINIMCEAAKQSLKKNTMHIPPWRKHRYMRAKWLGPYKRIVNPVSNPHNGTRNSTLTHAKTDLYFGNRLHFRDDDRSDIQWKLPSVSSKPVAEKSNGKVSRLSSALTEAGLTSNFSRSQGSQRL